MQRKHIEKPNSDHNPQVY